MAPLAAARRGARRYRAVGGFLEPLQRTRHSFRNQTNALDRQREQNFLTLRLTAELFRLLELFSANGISALLIKGPVLAAQAYGDPCVRSYGDLDLLVRPTRHSPRHGVADGLRV